MGWEKIVPSMFAFFYLLYLSIITDGKRLDKALFYKLFSEKDLFFFRKIVVMGNLFPPILFLAYYEIHLAMQDSLTNGVDFVL